MKSKKEEKFDTLFMEDIESTLASFFEKGKSFTVYPKGRSMLPTLKEGKDSVELSPVYDVKENGIYLYKRKNGEYAMHRLLKFSGNGYVFSGDNQLVFENVKKEQLIATVSRIYKNGKPYDATIRYRIFLFLNSVRFFRWQGIMLRKLRKKLWGI